LRALASLFLAVVLSCAVVVSAGAKASSRSVTFHLVENQYASNFIDNPPRNGPNEPPLIGDEFVFTSNLSTRAGKHAGRLSAMCMIANGGRNAGGPCYGVFSFEGGQLMGIAGLDFTKQTTQIAIVGGTGVYAGASGTITSVSRGENSPISDDTFHVLLP